MTERMISEHVEKAPGKEDGEPIRYQLFENSARPVEVYLDGMQGISIVGAVVKINCFTRGDKVPAYVVGESVERRDVACRLVMGVDTFFSCMDWLKRFDAEHRSKILGATGDGAAPKDAPA